MGRNVQARIPQGSVAGWTGDALTCPPNAPSDKYLSGMGECTVYLHSLLGPERISKGMPRPHKPSNTGMPLGLLIIDYSWSLGFAYLKHQVGGLWWYMNLLSFLMRSIDVVKEPVIILFRHCVLCRKETISQSLDLSTVYGSFCFIFYL